MSTNAGLNLQSVPNLPHWDNPIRHYITVNLSKWRIWLDALRDDGKCKAILSGCLRSANQVHHLSYQHVGNEPLFELISVCSACHDKITAMDRDRKNGSSA